MQVQFDKFYAFVPVVYSVYIDYSNNLFSSTSVSVQVRTGLQLNI
jgi:hypothetical protein